MPDDRQIPWMPHPSGRARSVRAKSPGTDRVTLRTAYAAQPGNNALTRRPDTIPAHNPGHDPRAQPQDSQLTSRELTITVAGTGGTTLNC